MSHIADLAPVGGALAVAHSAGVVAKATGAGLLFGWVFWRWGLAYAFACHAMANAAHMLAAPFVF